MRIVVIADIDPIGLATFEPNPERPSINNKMFVAGIFAFANFRRGFSNSSGGIEKLGVAPKSRLIGKHAIALSIIARYERDAIDFPFAENGGNRTGSMALGYR